MASLGTLPQHFWTALWIFRLKESSQGKGVCACCRTPPKQGSGRVTGSICYRLVPESPLAEAEACGHPQAGARAGRGPQMGPSLCRSLRSDKRGADDERVACSESVAQLRGLGNHRFLQPGALVLLLMFREGRHAIY